MFNQLFNTPEEMRQYRNWVVWRYEDTDGSKPTKVPYSPKTGRRVGAHDINDWGSFEDVVQLLSENNTYNGAGFFLSDNDPFGFIDLDACDGNAELHAKQELIFKESTGYAELSPSGEGLHIIVKASLPHGRRRGKIEVYTSQRYMTMTGNVYRAGGIDYQQDLMTALYNKLGEGRNTVNYYLGLEEPTETDEEVYERALKAENGAKFNELYNGDWETYYTSQSEADFALVDILAFYSHNKAQIKRMFLASKLGERDKAKRDDYVGYMLNRCFDRLLPPVDVEGLKNQIMEAVELRNRAEMQAQETERRKIENTDEITDAGIYTVPPGLVGEIAQFIYSQAPRQIPEIALAGAIGMVAGISGRAFNISGTGLNQYMMLLAPTGVGKEAMARGIDGLIRHCESVPIAQEFIGPGSIASAPALIKYMANGPKSFVSLVGEFGIWLQTLGADNAPPHMKELRKLILDLYNKSGQGNFVRPAIYADKEKSIGSFASPAFTLLGESTPEKFYEGLHEGLLSEGLLPRFTIIEYNGKKPHLNKNFNKVIPNSGLIERLKNLMVICASLNERDMAMDVGYADGARELMDDYGTFCTNAENSSTRDVVKQVWSRCHVKAMKMAALIAVGVNPHDPKITRQDVEWAKKIVNHDAENLLQRFDNGDITSDNGEHKQISAINKAIQTYILSPFSELKSYAGSTDTQRRLHSEKIVTYTYLHKKLAATTSYKKDKMGPTAALKRTIQTLIERGDISQVSPAKMSKDYNTSAKAYVIERISAFDI